MRVLVIADPIESLNPHGDSTLVLVHEALNRGYDVDWALDSDIGLRNHCTFVTASKCKAFEWSKTPHFDKPRVNEIKDYHSVWIRKDPPFDESYVKLCWLLSLEEKETKFFNAPSLLLQHHEKMIPYQAYRAGYLKAEDLIPTYSGPMEWVNEWIQGQEASQFVDKPFFGYGGREVQALSSLKSYREGNLLQPFQSLVQERGDRRVFFLNGKLLAHFVRMPASGGFVSNLAQGGTAVRLDLTPREAESIERLGKYLSDIGIVFAGADLIGHHISEVNITSPTGLRNLHELEGDSYSKPILDALVNARHGEAEPKPSHR